MQNLCLVGEASARRFCDRYFEAAIGTAGSQDRISAVIAQVEDLAVQRDNLSLQMDRQGLLHKLAAITGPRSSKNIPQKFLREF